MQVVDLPLEQLREAPWNPNRMSPELLHKLAVSVDRYTIVRALVVRELALDCWEVVSGNQLLSVLRERGDTVAPCIIVDVDDAHARLLADTLNHLHGEPDLGLRAELLRTVLETVPEADVLAVLPESIDNLRAFASIGKADLAKGLEAWQLAQNARLLHLQFQLTPGQMPDVETALQAAAEESGTEETGNPNMRGNALYLICQAYLRRKRRDA